MEVATFIHMVLLCPSILLAGGGEVAGRLCAATGPLDLGFLLLVVGSQMEISLASTTVLSFQCSVLCTETYPTEMEDICGPHFSAVGRVVEPGASPL